MKEMIAVLSRSAALFLIALMPPAAPCHAKPLVDLELEERLQFEELNLQIANWPKLVKKVSQKKQDLAAQAYRPESLIAAEDRDAADIVARRTASVLAAVKRLGPKAEVGAAEKKLGELAARVRATAPADKDARSALPEANQFARRQYRKGWEL